MKKGKVTFIMQAFNSKRFLKQSIESVLKQSEGDIRLIVRNNASTDSTGSMIRAYARKDKRVTCLENKEPYVTDDGIYYRHLGWWPKIDSEYVSIIDHDDILDEDFVKIMYPKAKEQDADMAVCGCAYFDDKTYQVIGQREIPDMATGNFQDLEKDFPAEYGVFRTVWGKLYKTELFETYYEESFSFPQNLYLTGDTWRLFNYLEHCKTFVSVGKPLYFYRVSEGSQFQTKLDKRRIGDADILYEKALGFLQKFAIDTPKNVEFLSHVHWGHMYDILGALKKAGALSTEEKLDYVQEILDNQRLRLFIGTHFEEVFSVVMKFIKDVIPETAGDCESLNRFYIFRLYNSYVRVLKDRPHAFFFLLSAILDEDNKGMFGMDLLGEEGYARTAAQRDFGRQSPDRRLAALKGGRKELIKGFLDQTMETRVEKLEDSLAESVEEERWEDAAGFLEALAEIYPEDEYVVYYRIYLSCLIGEQGAARELAYAARTLYFYEENMVQLCDAVLEKEGETHAG